MKKLKKLSVILLSIAIAVILTVDELFDRKVKNEQI